LFWSIYFCHLIKSNERWLDGKIHFHSHLKKFGVQFGNWSEIQGHVFFAHVKNYLGLCFGNFETLIISLNVKTLANKCFK
jgi:hypothetical protein